MAYFHTTVLDEQIKALPTVDTASGSVATFNTDLTENLISCIAEISASATKCYLVNMSDITNFDFFNGLIIGTYQYAKLSDCIWSYDSGRNVFYTTSIKGYKNGTPFLTVSFSDAHNVGLDDVPNMGGTLRAAALYLKNAAYTDIPSFVASLGDDYCIYELQTPIVPTITASDFNTIIAVYDIDGWCYEYNFGETVSSGATLECVSGTLTRNDDSIKSIGGNILSVLSDNNIFASTGNVEVDYILSVGKAIS